MLQRFVWFILLVFSSIIAFSQEPELFMDLNEEGDGEPRFLYSNGEQLFFSAFDEELGRELFVSDGTVDGTKLIADLYELPGAGGHPGYFNTCGGKTMFLSRNDTSIHNIYITDGTTEGTELLMPLEVGASFSTYDKGVVQCFECYQDYFYFGAIDSINGVALWKSDGTIEGTVAVKTIAALDSVDFPITRTPRNFVQLKGKLYFTAIDHLHGREWWTTDGTEEGTYMLADLLPGLQHGVGNFDAANLIFEDKLCFSGRYHLYLYDPETNEFTRVSDAQNIIYLASFDGYLYFSAYPPGSSSGQRVLWKSDGTPEGSAPFLDEVTHAHIPNSNYLFFHDAGDNLWRTDGSELGTIQLTNKEEGEWLGLRSSIIYNDLLITELHDPVKDNQYWISDGTIGNTSFFKPQGTLNVNPGGFGLTYFTEHKGKLFFNASFDNRGHELYSFGDLTSDTKNIDLNISMLQAYPNPTKDKVFVSFDQERSLIHSITLLDARGQILQPEPYYMHEAARKFSISFSLSGLPAGVYFIRVVNKNGTVQVAKFSKC